MNQLENIIKAKELITPLKSNINFLFSEIRDCLNYRLNKKYRLNNLDVNRIFWGERGTHYSLLLKHLNNFFSMKNSKILLQGIQGGDEITDFLRYKPKVIVGCELFDYKESWDLLQKVSKQYRIPIYVVQNDIRNLCFSNDNFDIITSFAVYEHLANLDEALRESKRVLKKNGIILASLGPLYFCFGGDHFSGSGGIVNGYNHLLLSRQAYIDYFDSYSYQLGDKKEGYRKFIIEQPIFSYLKFDEYINLFRKYFNIEYLAIKISNEAILFKEKFPDKFDLLMDKFKLTCHDLIIKGIIVFLRKINSSC